MLNIFKKTKKILLLFFLSIGFSQSPYIELLQGTSDLKKLKNYPSIKKELDILSVQFCNELMKDEDFAKYFIERENKVIVGTYIDEAKLEYWYNYYKNDFGVKWAHEEAKRLSTHNEYKKVITHKKLIFHGKNFSHPVNPIFSETPTLAAVNKNLWFKISESELENYSIQSVLKSIELKSEIECIAEIEINGKKDYAFEHYKVSESKKFVKGYYNIDKPKKQNYNIFTGNIDLTEKPKIKFKFQKTDFFQKDTFSYTMKNYVYPKPDENYKKSIKKIFEKYFTAKEFYEFKLKNRDYFETTANTHDIYDGAWKNGKKNGKGTLFYADGNLYEGNWKNNIKSGKGKMTYKNGDIYEGNWKNGKKSGQGVLSYANGNSYNGNWKNGKRHGIGYLKLKSGKEIPQLFSKGEQIKDQEKINKLIKYKNIDLKLEQAGFEELFINYFPDDKKENLLFKIEQEPYSLYENAKIKVQGSSKHLEIKGLVLLDSGVAFKKNETPDLNPFFKNKYFLAYNETPRINEIKVKKPSDWEIIYSTASKEKLLEEKIIHEEYTYTKSKYQKKIKENHKYEGKYKNSLKSGYGKMFYTNGDKYEGYWKNDLKNGEGILTYSTGNIYKGFWKDGKKDGKGVLTLKTGYKIEQNYKNGLMIPQEDNYSMTKKISNEKSIITSKSSNDRKRKETEEKRQIELFNANAKKSVIYSSKDFNVTLLQNYQSRILLANLEIKNLTDSDYKSVWFSLSGKFLDNDNNFKKRIRFENLKRNEKSNIDIDLDAKLTDINCELLKTTLLK